MAHAPTTLRNEDPAPYRVRPTTGLLSPAGADPVREAEDRVIVRALEVLAARMTPAVDVLTSPQDLRAYLRLRLGGYESETFLVVYRPKSTRVLAFRPGDAPTLYRVGPTDTRFPPSKG